MHIAMRQRQCDTGRSRLTPLAGRKRRPHCMVRRTEGQCSSNGETRNQMSVSEISDQLDELAEELSAAVDAGKEPEDELLSAYGELLNVFVMEHPADAIAWLRE